MKDVTHTELFETLLDGDIDGMYYDLHNDFECVKMQYNIEEKRLELRFINDDYKVIATFYQATITNFTIYPGKPAGNNTLDLFYRGRFEKDNNLHEMTEAGEYYFYLNFVERNAIEVFARRAVLEMSRLNS